MHVEFKEEILYSAVEELVQQSCCVLYKHM